MVGHDLGLTLSLAPGTRGNTNKVELADWVAEVAQGLSSV